MLCAAQQDETQSCTLGPVQYFIPETLEDRRDGESTMLWKQAPGWTGVCLGKQMKVRDCPNKQEIQGRMGYSWRKEPQPVCELHWVPASG